MNTRVFVAAVVIIATELTITTSGSLGVISISIVPGSGNPGNDAFYEPSPAKVAVGSIVTWTNDDALPHTVTSGNPEKGSDGMFDSGLVNTDKSFSHTFDTAGFLDYYCTIHPWMIGKIIVQ